MAAGFWGVFWCAKRNQKTPQKPDDQADVALNLKVAFSSATFSFKFRKYL